MINLHHFTFFLTSVWAERNEAQIVTDTRQEQNTTDGAEGRFQRSPDALDCPGDDHLYGLFAATWFGPGLPRRKA